MSFVRRVKVHGNIYLALVESYRENGRVRQRYLRYIGPARLAEARLREMVRVEKEHEENEKNEV